jgi:MFS family permease
MDHTLEKLAFDEAQRAITQQQASLEAIRTRAVALLAAATVAGGFLGGQTVGAGGRGLGGWAAAALVTFFILGLLTVYILVPRARWTFSNNIDGLIAEADALTEEARAVEYRAYLRDWALWIQTHWRENKVLIDRLHNAYAASCVLLLGTVMLWTVQFASNHR